MATNTTNFGLKKPAYADTADIMDINGNMDKVDVSLNGLADAIAIVANNNTHGAITTGQYVYVHGHDTLAEGLYTAISNIAANATLSTSNLQADGSGGLNALNSNVSNIVKTYGSSDSFDSITEPGVHYINGTNSFWGTLIVTKAGTNINQFRIQNDGKIVESRSYNGSTWRAWERLALNSNKLPATSYSTYDPVTLGNYTAVNNGFLMIQSWVNASKTFTVKVGNTKLFEHFAGTAMNATAQIPVKAGTTLSITTDDSISSSAEIGKFVAT